MYIILACIFSLLHVLLMTKFRCLNYNSGPARLMFRIFCAIDMKVQICINEH